MVSGSCDESAIVIHFNPHVLTIEHETGFGSGHDTLIAKETFRGRANSLKRRFSLGLFYYSVQSVFGRKVRDDSPWKLTGGEGYEMSIRIS